MRWPLMAEAGGEGEGSGTGAGDSVGSEGAGQGAGTRASGDSPSLIDWRLGFPDNMRNAGIIQRHATPEAAAQTLIEQDQTLSRALILPDRRKAPKGSAEYEAGLQKMRATLRTYDPELAPPDTADEYTWEVPEGREEDPAFRSRWKATFHKEGLSPSQAQGIIREFWRNVADAENIRAAQDERSRVEGMKGLQAAFGARTDDQLIQATAAMGHVRKGYFTGVDEGQHVADRLNEAILPDGSRLMNDPIVVAGLAMIEEKLFEGKYIDGDIAIPGQGRLDAVKAEYDAIMEKRKAGEAHDQGRLLALAGQLAAAQDRAQQGGRRVA